MGNRNNRPELRAILKSAHCQFAAVYYPDLNFLDKQFFFKETSKTAIINHYRAMGYKTSGCKIENIIL